jgi:alpha-D-xyloside xylohydrolase
VPRRLPPLLGESQPLILATSYDPATGAVGTQRVDLGDRHSYGTVAEVPLAEPTVGPPLQMTVDHLQPNASRLIVSGGVVDAQSSLFMDTSLRETHGPVAVDPDSAQLSCGSLRSRTMRIDSLTRSVSAWPLHEQQWQVLHRHAPPLGRTLEQPGTWFASFELAHDEQLFGLGEDFGPFTKRGTSHRLWMEEAWTNTCPARYKPVPFLWSSAGWGVIVHTTNAVGLHLGSIDHSAWTVVVDDTDRLDLVLLTGTPAEMIATYHRLTGTPRVPPRWTFGTWQGRISYRSQDEVLAVAAELRARRLPCDVIHIDTDWFEQDWACDYRFSPSRFPDPASMIAQLREQGFRTSVWQWPNALAGTGTFTDGAANGWLAQSDDGSPALQDGFVGPAGVIDFSHPAARSWMSERIAKLARLGVAAIKTDFGEGAPTTARYHALDGAAAHNGYPLLYNDTIMATLDAVTDDAVVWSRSAWAGSQRFPIHWSGDGVARFEDLPCVVRSMLSMGVSGFPFYAHDIGGFSGVPEPALLVRWTQLGVFSSHIRFHGFPPREPWEFGEEAEQLIREWLDLRYRLMPYIWHTADQASTTGLPMCRAMSLVLPGDRACRDIDDQYLFGDDLLVAPILSPTGERLVYLPDDGWVHWFTGEAHHAGWQAVQSDLSTMPLFRRAGVHIPLAEHGAQHTAEIGLYATECG